MATSPLSLPSSPEPFSDEDNHPEPCGWWEAPEKEAPRRRCGKRRRRGKAPVESEGLFIHNPTPDNVKKMACSEEALERRLAFLEEQEREELAAEERKAAKKEWRPVPTHWDRAMKRLREDNLRALSNAEMADRSAEWRKAAGGE